MKTKTLVSLLALLGALLSTLNPQLSASPLGLAFTYQGRLTDGGVPANGSYDLRFAVFDAAQNGSSVSGVLTNAATAVSNGLFMVTLNFGEGIFAGDARWLEIAVRTNGSASDFTTVVPRQALTPSPYALYAPNAGVAASVTGGVAANQLTGSIAPANIGAGTIDSTKLAAGSVTSTQLAAGSVTANSLAEGTVSLGKLATLMSISLSTTFPNPTPATDDDFGSAVAAVGTDKLVIGAQEDDASAPNAGAAYLFSTSGTLLTTFTNPTPFIGDRFGIAVAGVGSDKVLVGAHFDNTGAPNAGAAYLFNTSGTLLTTFTNPTPATNEYFGLAAAAVGADKVLIGAYGDSTGAPYAGAAYLFSTNGTLLTTFTNPTPAASDFFGIAVAAVGTDIVLIGAEGDDTGAADAGAAYLFSISGTLLTTFTNPTPETSDVFGHALTAVGADKVLIGAYMDDTGASGAGVAYLFSTNGTLLTTFTNPTPMDSDLFGMAVAAVGTDKVLIGAEGDDTGAFGAGTAYLFSTNGTLLTSLTNPKPTGTNHFGYAVTAVGMDMVLIGANRDNSGASAVGAAYLFRLNPYLPGLGVADRSITTASLADGAVGSAQIAQGAVDAAKIAAGAVTATALAEGAVTADKLFQMPAIFSLLTLTNPTPEPADEFGCTVAAVGSDRLVVGAFQDNVPAAGGAGAAYLYDLSGYLLTTFTNPTPAALDHFGFAVAAVGTDRVLIGASQDDTGAVDAGAAYLFNTNGTLLTTFTNPTPAANDYFGSSVAAVGSDRVLIGAPYDDTGAPEAGAAYLLSTNGTLLATFRNPAPVASDYFGSSLVAVGNNRVLIGAYGADSGAPDSGVAYLFDLAGNLLTTITNPTPGGGDFFGFSVAAVGTNRVVLSAYSDNVNAVDAGAAYLFDLAGNLLTTFTNPTPVIAEKFGYAISAAGNERVVIGAYGNALGARAAYIFDLAGNLLTTLTNPSPATDDGFSRHLTVAGVDRVLVGAPLNDTGATDAGVSYLFTLRDFAPGLLADGVRPGAITTLSLEDAAVTQAKLAAGAVGSGQLAVGAVGSAQLAPAAVGTAQLATNAVGSANIAPGAITAAELAKPPRAGSILSSTLFLDFNQAQFSVSFSPPFNTAPVITLGFEATGNLGAESTLFLTSKSANGLSGGWHAPPPSPVTVVNTVGWYSSLTVVHGRPAISFYDQSNGGLKYVRAYDESGTDWRTPTTVDGPGIVGVFTSLAMVNSSPAISYADNSGNLKYVRAADLFGVTWGTPMTVVSASSVRYRTSLGVVNGNPAISYGDDSDNLKYIRAIDASGTAWPTAVTVESALGNNPCPSLAVVNGNPAISYSYREPGNDALKYVRATDTSGTSWAAPVTVYSEAVIAESISLAVVNSRPAISFVNSYGYRRPIYVWANDASGTSWATPVVVDNSVKLADYWTSLAVVNGNPAICYTDGANDVLKYIRATDASGTAWATPVTVTVIGSDFGSWPSLAQVNGQPAVSYYDGLNTNLKFVRQGDLLFTINWIALEP